MLLTWLSLEDCSRSPVRKYTDSCLIIKLIKKKNYSLVQFGNIASSVHSVWSARWYCELSLVCKCVRMQSHSWVFSLKLNGCKGPRSWWCLSNNYIWIWSEDKSLTSSYVLSRHLVWAGCLESFFNWSMERHKQDICSQNRLVLGVLNPLAVYNKLY